MIGTVTTRWWARLADRVVPSRRAARTRPRGTVVTGTVWRGGDDVPRPGRVALDGDGRIVTIEIDRPGTPPVPPDVRHVAAAWVGPAPLDTFVHATSGHDLERWHAAGLAAVRDVRDAPAAPGSAAGTGSDAVVAVLSPDGDAGMLTATLRRCAADGIRAVTVDLTAGRDASQRAVTAAHEHGLAVLALTPTADLVARALDAGVDELLRVPAERLPEALVDRLAAAGVAVSSTLQAWFSAGRGRDAAINAAALVRAGVTLRYGTSRGRTPGGEPAGAPVGVDPRELDRLADTGLGRLGALRAATDGAAAAAGLRGPTGKLLVGARADVVALAADPLVEPLAWRGPLFVVIGGRVLAAPPG